MAKYLDQVRIKFWHTLVKQELHLWFFCYASAKTLPSQFRTVAWQKP